MKRLLEDMPDALLRDAVVAIAERDWDPDKAVTPQVDWYRYVREALFRLTNGREVRELTAAGNIRDVVREEVSWRWLQGISPTDYSRVKQLRDSWLGG